MVRIWLVSPTFRAAFEIVALAAARLGTIPRAAQSVIMTTDQGALCCPPQFHFLIINICISQVLNSIPFGIGMAPALTVVMFVLVLGSLTTTQVSLRPHVWATPLAGATQLGPSSPDTSRHC
jgi:hypothetical protein